MSRDEVIVLDDWKKVVERLLNKVEDILEGQERFEKVFKKMNQAETAAFGRLADGVGRLGPKIDAAFQAATTANQTLRDNIAQLQAAKDALQAAFDADEVADQATVDQLQATIDALTAAAESDATEVVGKLDEITNSVGTVEGQVDHLNPETPSVPEPEPAPTE